MPTSEHAEPLRLTSLSTAPLSAVMLTLSALWIGASDGHKGWRTT
jgi:hypothetical protein